jgi:hypothetical protein
MANLPHTLIYTAFVMALRHHNVEPNDMIVDTERELCIAHGLALTLDTDRLADFGEYVLFTKPTCLRCNSEIEGQRFDGFERAYPNAQLCEDCEAADMLVLRGAA